MDLVKQELENLKTKLNELYKSAAESDDEDDDDDQEEEEEERIEHGQQQGDGAGDVEEDDDLSYADYDEAVEDESSVSVGVKPSANIGTTVTAPTATATSIATATATASVGSPAQHRIKASTKYSPRRTQSVAVGSPVPREERSALSRTQSYRDHTPTPEEIEEQRMLDRKLQERLSEKMSKQEIKMMAKLHRKESVRAKRKSVEERLEEMMDAMRRGERPHIYNAKRNIIVRPLPGTVFEEDEGTIRARQEIQWRNRIRLQRQRYIEQSLMMDRHAVHQRPIYEDTLVLHSGMRSNQSQLSDVADDPLNGMQRSEGIVYGGVSRVVHNEQIQQRLGSGVANLAQNEAVQQRIASGIGHFAENEKYRSAVGETIARSSDSAIVQQLARNKAAQQAVGTALAKTVGNKDVQRRVGQTVANSATNREVQQKVASGLMSMGAMAVKGAKAGARATVAGAKMGYEMYRDQNQQHE